MPELVINGIALNIPEGATLLEAAALAGVTVPTLCHEPGLPPRTSCMLCVVEETRTGRLLPACAARAEAGMIIETHNARIVEARRDVLELLLSEHAGDCEAPCHRSCPASMNIPLMLRALAGGDAIQAARVARNGLVLPATLGYVCTAPCEAGCRRGAHDEAIAIKELHRQAAMSALESAMEPPACAPTSGRRVAVMGSGPAGLAAAWVLRRYGHACRAYEKAGALGGTLRTLPEVELPKEVLDAEIALMEHMGVAFECESRLEAPELAAQYDAVVIAGEEVDRGLKGRRGPIGPIGPIENSDPKPVFFAQEHRMAVRAVAAGKAAAEEAHRFLLGLEAPPRAYDSSLGRIGPDRIAAYAVNRVSPGALSRGRQSDDAAAEAGRCLHCDCHTPVSCRLRQYATEYGARPRAYRQAERPSPGIVQRHGGVVFDPGKCIKCGLCIDVAREQGEPLGLTFVGRGFDTHVAVPFGESLAAGLKMCAAACVAACPTGALAFDNQEEREP